VWVVYPPIASTDVDGLDFPGESEQLCTLDDISWLDKHLRALSTNAGILLANLFPPSQANISAQAFPWSCALHEAIREAQFSTLPSSPTVSRRF
jgi:hypothetical protein